MPSGLSPKLPLQRDFTDGYTLNKSYAEMVTQNLKMLILTAPGERVMDPDFGVGIRNFLFEPNHEPSYSVLETTIRQQVERYMPFLEVQIVIFSPEFLEEGDPNSFKLQIKYLIRPLSTVDAIEILVEDTN